MRDFHDEDEGGDEGTLKGRVFTEFECPKCDAHNPSDGFKIGDEIFCFYCGASLKAHEKAGRVKLKEV